MPAERMVEIPKSMVEHGHRVALGVGVVVVWSDAPPATFWSVGAEWVVTMERARVSDAISVGVEAETGTPIPGNVDAQRAEQAAPLLYGWMLVVPGSLETTAPDTRTTRAVRIEMDLM